MNVSLLHASKLDKFNFFHQSLMHAGLGSVDSRFILCPLCWKEKDLSELTLEHMVPSSVGGRLTTLTCKECNNTHGATRDAHLLQYLRSLESIEGHGLMHATLNINGHRVKANLDWADKNFHIVAKASNPASVAASKKELASGHAKSIEVTVSFGFKENNFNTAVLRSAYLILFKCFGYEYLRHETLQSIRRRIMDDTIDRPDLRTLILGLNFTPPWDAQHYIFEAMMGEMRCFVVVIRIRRKTTRYLAACLPCPVGRCDEFFNVMQAHAEGHGGGKFELSVSRSHIFS